MLLKIIWLNSKYSRVVCKQERVYDGEHKGRKMSQQGDPEGFQDQNDFMDGHGRYMYLNFLNIVQNTVA